MKTAKNTAQEENISRTKVTVLHREGESVLVEYSQNGAVDRRYIPAIELGDKYVLDSVLNQGIQYGYPWDEIELKFDNQKFAAEMRNVGIWTVEDALQNPQRLWSALNATLADNLSIILKTASSEKRRSK